MDRAARIARRRCGPPCTAASNVSGLDVAGAHLLWAVELGGPSLLRDPATGEAFVRATLRVATADNTADNTADTAADGANGK